MRGGPEHSHITTELRYPGQMHGYNFLTDNTYKVGNSYIPMKPLLKIDNSVKLPLYIAAMDSYIWMDNEVNITISSRIMDNYTITMNTAYLISPNTA